MLATELSADRVRRHAPAGPALDAESEAQGRVLLSVLDFADPAGAGRGKAELDGQLRQGEASLGSNRGEIHDGFCSTGLNRASSRRFQLTSTDVGAAFSHDVNMAPPATHDWYLREWFATMGLKQRDLVTKLDYQTQTAFNLWHSIQPYRRDHVEAISALLNIQPFELLMPPAEAMALRRLRATIAEVAKAEAPALPVGEVPGRTGTDG